MGVVEQRGGERMASVMATGHWLNHIEPIAVLVSVWYRILVRPMSLCVAECVSGRQTHHISG